MTTTGLTSSALNVLTKSGMSTSGVNALKTAASSSQYFCDLLNSFASGGSSYKLVVGAAGTGTTTTTDSNGSVTISIDKSWVTGASGSNAELWNVFATTVSHELGHAVLADGNNPTRLNDPAQAVATGGTNEGVALTAEYIVSKQLGMGSASGVYMHSDNGQGLIKPTGYLTSQMDQDALAAGVNVMGLRVGSTFNDVTSQAVKDGSAFTLDYSHPSNAPGLTYREYYADWNIILSCKNTNGLQFNANSVDWLHLQPGDLQYQSNADGTCTFSAPHLKYSLSGQPDGVATISGTLNAAGLLNASFSLDNNNDGIFNSVEMFFVNSGGGASDHVQGFTSTGALQYDQQATYSASGALTATISGQGAVANLNNGAIALANGSTATINGSNLTVSAGGNSTATVLGSGDHINATGSGDAFTIGGNGSNGTGALTDDVHAAGANVTVQGNSNVNVYDSSATITAGQNVNFGAYGAGLSVTAGAGCSVWVGANGAAASGSSSDLIFGTPGTVTVASNSNVTAFVSSANVVGGTQSSFGVCGSGDNVTAPSGSSVWIGGNGQNAAAGAIDVLHGSGATVTVYDNSRVDIYDASATIFGGNNVNFGAYGAGLTVNGTTTSNIWTGGNGETGSLDTVIGAPYVAVQDNSHVVVNGAATVLAGAFDSIAVQNTNNATVTVNGNSTETYTNSPNITVYDYGASDLSVGQSTNTITYEYGNYGETDNMSNYDTGYQYGQYDQGYNANTTDSIYSSSGTSGVGISTTGRFSAFDWGYAGNRAAVDNSVANRVVPNAVAQAAGNGSDMFNRLQLAIGTSSNATVTGARFDHGTITWAFDKAIQATSAEAAAASDAFAAWAAASGLRFQQTSGGTTADIVLTFSDLDTAHTGVVGLTSSQSVHGVTQPGVLIRVEDPDKTPLVADMSGQLVYSGTQATLAQVFMHEIGHALGLGDNADPDSIESYYLGAGNRGIGAADADAIRYLYSSPADGGPYVSQQVLDAMKLFAGFAPAQGASAVHLVGAVHHGPVAVYEGGGGV